MRFEMRVLDAMRGVGSLVDCVGRFESRFDVADVAVNFEQYILPRTPDARLRALIVDDGRALAHRFFGIEDRGQQLIVDLDPAASLFRRAFRFGYDGGDSLPDKPNHVVEQVRVVGIDVVVVVSGGGIEQPGDVFPGVDRAYAGHRERGVLADCLHARVGVRRSEQFQMQHALHRGVEGIADLARDDLLCRRRQQSRAARLAGLVLHGLLCGH